jgi:hypothetical protein
MKSEDIKVYLDTSRVPLEYFINNPTELTPDQPVTITKLRYELVPMVGALTYVKDATYPRKGIPAEDMIYAINIIKEVLKNSLQYKLLFVYFFINKERVLTSFNNIFEKAMRPYRLNQLYICHSARMAWYFTSTFLQGVGVSQAIANNVGYNIAHLLELDDAYRYRLQDIATEANEWELALNPRKEIKRLVKILADRQGYNLRGVTVKIMLLVTPLLWLLFIPKYRQAFIKASKYVKDMKYDEADWYWTAFKDNYCFGGKTHKQRIAEGIAIPEMYK